MILINYKKLLQAQWMGPFCPPLYNIKTILGYFRGYFRGYFIFMYGFAVIDFQV